MQVSCKSDSFSLPCCKLLRFCRVDDIEDDSELRRGKPGEASLVVWDGHLNHWSQLHTRYTACLRLSTPRTTSISLRIKRCSSFLTCINPNGRIFLILAFPRGTVRIRILAFASFKSSMVSHSYGHYEALFEDGMG